ncbi:unnamed protein product [Polarella glacialis]|uniref:EF-hand domain-containing protein n=1 Tax=Polarella glacialis TaxID=89957 RepID=A0A813LWX1_POLGL|nr:unnamed protein product [Polarella glacialis]
MSSMASSQVLGSTAFLAVGGAPRPAALRGSPSSPSSELGSRRAGGSSSGGPQVTSHDTLANWTGLTACLSLAASLAVKRKANRRSATKASIVGLKARGGEEQQQQDRLSLFRSFDLDSSGAIDDQELRKGLQKLGLKLDAPKATKLLRMLDMNGDGMLQLEEFNLTALPRAGKLIEKWRAAERAAEDASRAPERQAKELESEKQAEQEFLASLPLENNDAGLPTRPASVFDYLLPVMDALRYGGPKALAIGIGISQMATEAIHNTRPNDSEDGSGKLSWVSP